MTREKTESDEPVNKNNRPAEKENTEVKIEIEDQAESESEDIIAESADEEQPPEAETEDDSKSEEPPESESERYLRLAAEFDNYKKRTAREFGELIKTANSRLLRSLVDVLDNFERALDGDAAAGDSEAYRKGVELIYNQFTDLLERENVKTIDAVGQPFDPNLHEAMMQRESDDYDDGVVCAEIQKGYRIGDRILRHARVVVSKGPQKEEDENKNSE